MGIVFSLLRDKLLEMKGYSFTFGGYRVLDDIDTHSHPQSFTRDRKDELKIVSDLKPAIFGIHVIMSIIRDYVPGGALLPIDLFPPREIKSNEIYQLLFSVACCRWCTRDVIKIVGAHIKNSSLLLRVLSPIQILHLIYRCSFLKVKGNIGMYFSLYFPDEMMPNIQSLMCTSEIYSDLRYKILCKHPANRRIERNIMEGISLRVTNGRDLKKLLNRYSRYESDTLDEEELIALITFGKRSYLRKVRRVYGRKDYYQGMWSLMICASFLTYPPSWKVLGLEEIVVLSISAHMNTSMYGEWRRSPQREMDMWTLPRILLRGSESANSVRCATIIVDDYQGQSMTLQYCYGGRDRYTVSLREDEGKVQYVCGNGMTYSYYMLLFIIVKRFIFTYDREYLIDSLLRLVNVEETSITYLDTPTTHPPIHDLICPPDIFHSKDKDVRIDPQEVFFEDDSHPRRRKFPGTPIWTDLTPMMKNLFPSYGRKD